MRNHTTHTRDAALRRLSHINRWLVAGSIILTGVLADAAANAFPGKTKASSSSSGTKRSSSHTGASKSSLSKPEAVAGIQHQLQRRIRLRQHRSQQLLGQRRLGRGLLGQRIVG